MKKTLTRAAVTVAAASVVGAGAIAAAAPAHAGTPGDLQIIGGVTCTFKPWGPNWNSGPVWQMHRFLGVTNLGDGTMTGVTVSEIGGANKWTAVKGQKPGVLPGHKTYIAVSQTWKGCWPASISGYTIGQQVENPFNNAGYWQNVDTKKYLNPNK
ncbi:MAG: hypothetical protein QM774_09350 [Gordonia sp. (in: high G+C Gram-positive bacteria)]|uniref:hypothetical protein n=1 Tax=Gordonia sp. (in: high G+C Gram-positive bacteria) TaxID=84139 RepID=UPI0039E62AD9